MEGPPATDRAARTSIPRRRTRPSVRFDPLLASALALGGFVFAFAAMLGGDLIGVLWSRNLSSAEVLNLAEREFLATGNGIVWLFVTGILGAATALGAGLIYNAWAEIRACPQRQPRSWPGDIAFGISCAGLFGLPLLPCFYYGPVPDKPDYPSEILYGTAFLLVIMPAFLLMRRTHVLANDLATRHVPAGAGPGHPTATQYFVLARKAQLASWVLAGLLSVALLAFSVYRSAWLDYKDGAVDFPAIIVWTLGAYYTLLIALVYVPVSLSLRGAGRRLLDAMCPPGDPGCAGDAEAERARLDLATRFGLHRDSATAIRDHLVVLGPVASAVVGALLGTG